MLSDSPCRLQRTVSGIVVVVLLLLLAHENERVLALPFVNEGGLIRALFDD